MVRLLRLRSVDFGHPRRWRHVIGITNALAEVRRCLAADEDVSVRGEWATTPLHFAASLQPAATVKLLLAEGANVGARDDRGAHPLHYAAANPDREVASLLLGAGAEVDGQDGDDHTPLHWAAAEGTPGVATDLLAAGARLEARDFGRKDAIRPRRWTAWNGCLPAAEGCPHAVVRLRRQAPSLAPSDNHRTVQCGAPDMRQLQIF